MVSLTVKRPFFDDFLYQIYKKKTDRGWVPLMIQVNLNKWGGATFISDDILHVLQVRKKRFFLDGKGLNLASLFVIDLFPTTIKPTNLLRLTVDVED